MAKHHYPELPPALQPIDEIPRSEWLPLEPGDPGYTPVGNGENALGGSAGGLGETNANGSGDLSAISQHFDFMSAPFLLGNVGAPLVIGLAVGYFAKKVLKIALFLAGAAIVLLFITEYYGMTTLSDDGLQNAASAATNMAKESSGFLLERLSQISTKGVSAAAGFFLGLKLG